MGDNPVGSNSAIVDQSIINHPDQCDQQQHEQESTVIVNKNTITSMNPTPLYVSLYFLFSHSKIICDIFHREYFCWSTRRTERRICLSVSSICLAITIGILIVFLTSPKSKSNCLHFFFK